MDLERTRLAVGGESTDAAPYGAAHQPAESAARGRDVGDAGAEHPPTWRLAASSVGFLADSYDFFTIDVVVLILGLIYGEAVIGPAQKSMMVGFMLLGTITGQLLFGFAADRFGRKWCFVATAGLTTIGALLSASVQVESLAVQLAFCRLFLGFGVGGEYPLSAAVTAEISTDPNRRGRYMVSLLTMQAFGMMLSCVLAMACMWMELSLALTWRFLLAFGALPSLVAFYLRWRMHESESFTAVRLSGESPSLFKPGTLAVYGPTLIGTAGCWMMANLSFYSMGSFKSTILNDLMPDAGLSDRAKVTRAAGFAALTSIFAFIGFSVAYLLINRMGRFRMQLVGFLALSAIFSVLAALSFVSAPSGLYILLLGVMFLFQNFGPNSTTYIIPAEAFPTRLRGTCHGISAACGKLGALLGTAALPFVEATQGLPCVYLACGAAAMIGVVLTSIFTPRAPDKGSELDDNHFVHSTST